MNCKHLSAAVFVLFFATIVRGEEPKIEVLLEGLNTPAGLAVQPQSKTPFFSESGAGIVCKYTDGRKVPVIKGFPMGTYGEAPVYPIGPLGLAFLDPNMIVVGCGGGADGADDIRVFKWSKVDPAAAAAAQVAEIEAELARKTAPVTPKTVPGTAGKLDDLFGAAPKAAPAQPVPVQGRVVVINGNKVVIKGNTITRTATPTTATTPAKPEATIPILLADTDEVLQFDKPLAILGPLAESGETPGEGNFYGIAISDTSIIAASNGDDEKGWVVRSIYSKSSSGGYKFGTLRRFIATKPEVKVDAPAGVTFTPNNQIAVGQMGEITDIRDSLLTFYARRGKMLANFKTGLFDIVDIAYCPKTGLLYAVDFAWAQPGEGGLFRLDAALGEDKKPAVKAVKIMSLDHPSALAFDSDGILYVTEVGKAAKDKPAAGRLLKITLPKI